MDRPASGVTSGCAPVIGGRRQARRFGHYRRAPDAPLALAKDIGFEAGATDAGSSARAGTDKMSPVS
jgi:hypothetical protein